MVHQWFPGVLFSQFNINGCLKSSDLLLWFLLKSELTTKGTLQDCISWSLKLSFYVSPYTSNVQLCCWNCWIMLNPVERCFILSNDVAFICLVPFCWTLLHFFNPFYSLCCTLLTSLLIHVAFLVTFSWTMYWVFPRYTVLICVGCLDLCIVP